MAAYKMAAVNITPPNDFPLGLIRLHIVVILLFLIFCDLQKVVRNLCRTLYYWPYDDKVMSPCLQFCIHLPLLFASSVPSALKDMT